MMLFDNVCLFSNASTAPHLGKGMQAARAAMSDHGRIDERELGLPYGKRLKSASVIAFMA